MEQTHIGEVFALQLGQIHATQTALQMGLGHSIAQRQDILRAVFSGQLAPQDPSDEPVSMLSERIRAERASQPARKKPHGRKAKEAA